uniref:DUF641 domain-containing protein n=1 Tax=Kalanchoe fedtschenkoi TaxID=63787 RepID=A0A7N0ZZ49_KALFE
MEEAVSKKSRLSRTLSRVVHIPTSARSKLYKQNRDQNSSNREDSSFGKCCSWQQMSGKSAATGTEMKTRAAYVIKAFIAKLFASASSIKAAYAELQLAQSPYNSSVIQTADDAIVAELQDLAEMKRSFLKKQIDLSPQVTLLLAEVQEQQSLMKTYEIMLRKLENDSKTKDAEAMSLKSQLNKSLNSIKSMETKLNTSGALSILHGVELRDLTHSHFSQALHYALRCVRSFAKVLVREMEDAGWDLSLAVESIAPGVVLQKQSHQIYAFESFVNKVMFAGFNGGDAYGSRQKSFNEFKKLRSLNPKLYLSENPNSQFGAFLRSKYVNLVHPKIECSLFGSLHHRSAVTSGQLPDSEFFTAFTEMVKRVWLLNLLATSCCSQVSAFQVASGCRFSEVYMESVTEEVFIRSESCVGFTVAPGFQVGGTVVQCLVYLSPPPVNRRSTGGQSS